MRGSTRQSAGRGRGLAAGLAGAGQGFYELRPEAPAIAAEAVGGALYALFYDHVKQKGAERLPEMVPLANYVTLAPFLGGDEAYRVATE